MLSLDEEHPLEQQKVYLLMLQLLEIMLLMEHKNPIFWLLSLYNTKWFVLHQDFCNNYDLLDLPIRISKVFCHAYAEIEKSTFDTDIHSL